MLPLLSQRRFVLLHDGETDVWPRLGLPRHLPRQPMAIGPTTLLRAADRPGARRPGAPPLALRPDGAPGGEPEAGDAEPPPAASGDRPREPSPQPRAEGGDPPREPSPAPAQEDGEDRKPEDHRGS